MLKNTVMHHSFGLIHNK